MYRFMLLQLERGKQNVCILCESKRSRGMSLVEGKIKWEKRWRENNDREHGEGGPPQSIYSYLWQASPLGRFFEESWPTFTPVNAFLPQAYIIHSCQSSLILHVRTAVKIHAMEKPVHLKLFGRKALLNLCYVGLGFTLELNRQEMWLSC